MKVETLLFIGFILLFALFIYANRKLSEGFDEQMYSNGESSDYGNGESSDYGNGEMYDNGESSYYGNGESSDYANGEMYGNGESSDYANGEMYGNGESSDYANGESSDYTNGNGNGQMYSNGNGEMYSNGESSDYGNGNGNEQMYGNGNGNGQMYGNGNGNGRMYGNGNGNGRMYGNGNGNGRMYGNEGSGDGDVPIADETSEFPRDTSSATTTNPQIALAQPKDIQALMEVIKNFKLLYNAQDPMTLNLDPQSLKQTQYFSMQSDNLLNQLQAALADSDAVSMSFDDTVQLRKAYECSIDILRGKSETGASQESAPNGLSVGVLDKLKERVEAESLRLSNLRSSSDDVMTRISELDKLSSDLGDIISSVNRGQTDIADIDISPAEANSFLNSGNQNGAVPNLTAPSGGSTNSMTIGPTGLTVDSALQTLVGVARNMKWSVNIALESDPDKRQSQDVLDKIDAIEKNINQYVISGTPIPPNIQKLYEQELAVLKNLTGGSEPDMTTVVLGPPKPALYQKGNASQAYMPSLESLNAAQGFNMGPAAASSSNGIGSGDYGMTDDNIQHRASAASFDDSMVGGLDYKKRVMEMCRQIQAANLGDPAEFGCIKNPNEVSASYSWKGNYQMVCSRLGNTWGNWYPQMFGCPKIDPTAKFTRKT
jgi:hypothetical protein